MKVKLVGSNDGKASCGGCVFSIDDPCKCTRPPELDCCTLLSHYGLHYMIYVEDLGSNEEKEGEANET